MGNVGYVSVTIATLLGSGKHIGITKEAIAQFTILW